MNSSIFDADVSPETTEYRDLLTFHPEILDINRIAQSGKAGPGLLNYLEVKLREILNSQKDDADSAEIRRPCRRLIRQAGMYLPEQHLAYIVEKLHVLITRYGHHGPACTWYYEPTLALRRVRFLLMRSVKKTLLYSLLQVRRSFSTARFL